MAFDPQPTRSGYGYSISPMTEADRDALYHAASDPVTWAGHPATDRYKREVFDPYFDSLLASKETVILRTEQGDVIGCSRYYPAPDVPNSISIGYTFIDCKYWGGATNRAFKRLMLEYAFETFDEVWLHIAPSNIRSQKASVKIGAKWRYDANLSLGGGAVQPWKCYTVSQADWNAALPSGNS